MDLLCGASCPDGIDRLQPLHETAQMLQLLVDYGVPANLIVLMLISGTEIQLRDFARLFEQPRAVLLGTIGQLLLLPPLVLLVCAVISPPAAVAAGTMLLALSPGGGISNYYCYLGRCNILLSATITGLGTLLSLITIPFWIGVLPALSAVSGTNVQVPVPTILAQLTAFMILPLGAGMLLRHALPDRVEAHGKHLRWISAALLSVVLALAITTVRHDIVEYAHAMIATVVLFILAAMLVGWIMGYGLDDGDRPVLVIESGVRNVGVALIVGKSLLERENFGILAGYLTAYFVIEVLIMVSYARTLASRSP
jgi:BASS family bile acid:Na+ symporter